MSIEFIRKMFHGKLRKKKPRSLGISALGHSPAHVAAILASTNTKIFMRMHDDDGMFGVVARMSACRNAETQFPRDVEQEFVSRTYEATFVSITGGLDPLSSEAIWHSIWFISSTKEEETGFFRFTLSNSHPLYGAVPLFHERFRKRLMDIMNSDEKTGTVVSFAPAGFFRHELDKCTDQESLDKIDAWKLSRKNGILSKNRFSLTERSSL